MIPGASRLAAPIFTLLTLLIAPAFAQIQKTDSAIPESLYSAMRWRMIGPHRGGRVLGVSGVRGQPETFYFGAVGGGVWKTTDAGHVWTPIFDAQPIASIGALAVAPSDPNMIYVGSGEADMRSDISFGDGVYKSTDAGQTWAHLGLRDTQQIGRILVDPHDPNLVFVAALGHGFGPNPERGVFRSTDGGRTWNKVLYKDENTGAIDLSFDPEDSQTIYAALWNVRRVAWSAYAPVNGPGSGLYKSTDGGLTWRELKGHGLPEGRLGRIGVTAASSTHGRRVYALIEAEPNGLYRSDDAGENWRLVGTDQRLMSRPWYFSKITVDPRNSDIVYVSNVSLYRSTDGGHAFQAIKGAPGGDDYHWLWIDPDNPQRMIVGSDQGATISVDGAKTWSSWYNQPTAQFYHVAVDTQFPYWVYGAQQDSGTAAVKSRSDFGQITFRDWHPVGAGESGYILPDPSNPDIVYGGSTGGELYRYDRRTGQVRDVTPTLNDVTSKIRHRYPWTTAIAFSRQPPHALYQGSQFLLKTVDGGSHWTTISPDLTLGQGAAPTSGREDEGKTVIYTIAPSPLTAGQLWVGTDNGLVQLTRDDGKTWHNVTPEGLPRWSMISIIHASAFDAGTAYAAVDRHQTDDLKPYIYRTRDFGKTWRKITDGIPEPAYVHVVREDSTRKGLLFAGTELGVYVSFDDGEHWQTLQLNLPVTSVRDAVVRGTDLVIATHGRSFWILDDITPLRQASAAIADEDAYLFKPATATRLRKNENRDTPLPPETPAGQNPPTGAIIDYTLKTVPSGEVTLEVLDGQGRLVRRFASSDAPVKVEDVQSFPTYWLRPPAPPSRRAGLNRFVWDLRFARPAVLRNEYSIAAAFGEDTPSLPEGPLVVPGTYQVRLTVGGRSYNAPLEVRMDPRVSLRPAALEQQLGLEMKIRDALAESYDAVQQIRDLRRQLGELQQRVANDPPGRAIGESLSALDRKAGALSATVAPPPSQGEPANLAALNGALASLMTVVDGSDAAPTEQAEATYREYRQALDEQLAMWLKIKTQDLPALNTTLQERQLPLIKILN